MPALAQRDRLCRHLLPRHVPPRDGRFRETTSARALAKRSSSRLRLVRRSRRAAAQRACPRSGPHVRHSEPRRRRPRWMHRPLRRARRSLCRRRARAVLHVLPR